MAQPGLPPTTIIQAFELFYTRFILRDFVGKIVPGLIFLFLSFMATDLDGNNIRYLKKINFIEGVTLLSVAWLFTLCSQSLHSRLMYFYFPRIKGDMRIMRFGSDGRKEIVCDRPMICYLPFFHNRELIYARELCEAYNFLREASADERAQYERYVVIKEACGNSFFCTLLGLISFSIVIFFKQAWASPSPFSAFIAAVGVYISHYKAEITVLIFWMTTAYLMKKDNLLRQLTFIESTKERHHLHKSDFLSIYRPRKMIDMIYWLIRGSR